MYCRECGAEIGDDARFCHRCGAFVDQAVPMYRPPAQPPRRRAGRTALKILVGVFIVLLGLAVIGSLAPDTYEIEPAELDLGDMKLRGGMISDDILPESTAEAGTLTYTGDHPAFWMWRDACASEYVESGGRYAERGFTRVTSDTLTFTEPGKYDVQLYVNGRLAHSGEVILDGEVERIWTWSRLDDGRMRNYAVSFIFEFSDYLEYSEDDSLRRGSTVLSDARFVVVDDDLLALEEALAQSYERTHRSAPERGSQDYADFLLSFVQMAIDYPPCIEQVGGRYIETDDGSPDTYLYGQEEYWAYPMETLYMGMGDCEDTSFLAAALFSAAGYHSAVATPPGHMVALVKLDSFQRDTSFELRYEGEAWGSFTTGSGDRYYFCETTYDSFAVPAGYYNGEQAADLESITTITPVDPYVAPGGGGTI